MFQGIRNLTERDRLAARVVELEKQVEDLQAEARRNLGRTNFREIMRPFTLDSNVRDHVVQRVVDDMSPLLERDILRTLKDCASMIKRDSYRAPQVTHAAMADLRNFQVEVHLPPLTTSFQMGGIY